MRLPITIAIICSAAAVVQCMEIAGRVAHTATIGWKTGFESSVITAGSAMVAVFFTATALFVGLGLFATDRLCRAASPFRFCSLLSVQLLLAGALIWGALLCSPLVQIVSR